MRQLLATTTRDFGGGGKANSIGNEMRATGGGGDGDSVSCEIGLGTSLREGGRGVDVGLLLLMFSFMLSVMPLGEGNSRVGRSGSTSTLGSIVSRGSGVGEDSRVEAWLCPSLLHGKFWFLDSPQQSKGSTVSSCCILLLWFMGVCSCSQD